MAKVSRYEQLDRAVQALLGGSKAPRALKKDAPFAGLVRVAAELRDLPSDAFRARLKRHLQRSVEMATQTTATPKPAPAATPYLCVRRAAEAIEFYKKAFGANEIGRLTQPDGKIAHAEVEIGGAMIMLADELPQYGFLSPQTIGGVPLKIHLYFDDVDALVRQAVAAGARLTRPIRDEFYGHREGQLTDPFGYTWLVSTVKEELTFAEIARRFRELTQPAPMKQQPVKPKARREQSVIPYLVVAEPLVYADFLKQVFDAEETLRTTGSAGGWHIEMNFGGTKVMMGGPRKGSASITLHTATLHLYVPDADAVYHRALAAGATSYFAPVDRPYGERQAGVKDPAGNTWYIATHHGPSHIPEDMAGVNLTLHYKDADLLIEFLKSAFGAEVPFVHRSPEGTYARARIGDTMLQIGETRGAVTPDSSMVLLTVDNADAAYQGALAAGAESIETPADQPYGARRAGVRDPFGTTWYVSSPLPKGRKKPRV